MSAAAKRLRGICTGSATVILLVATQSSLGPLQARATANGPTTESQAFAQAAESGDPVQIDTLTTKDTAIFANPNGTLTAQFSAGPVREPDPGSPSGWT